MNPLFRVAPVYQDVRTIVPVPGFVRVWNHEEMNYLKQMREDMNIETQFLQSHRDEYFAL